MDREHGFTLIELMVTLGVAAILLSIAVPAMQMFTSNARQTGAINNFVSSLHLARNTAITTNARVTMCASADGASCGGSAWQNGWILFRDPNNNGSVDADERVIGSVGETKKLAIASSEFGSALTYRPSGRVLNAGVVSSTGELTFCDHRGSDFGKVVILDLSGRPRVSKTSGDGSSPSCS